MRIWTRAWRPHGDVYEPALAASARMAFVGRRRQMRPPIAAFSRATTPRSSRTCSGPVVPPFTENTICCVVAPSTSWKYLRPSIPFVRTLLGLRRAGAEQTQGPELELERVRGRRALLHRASRPGLADHLVSLVDPIAVGVAQPVSDEADREVGDVDADPATPKALGRRDRGSAPAEGVQDHVARVAGLARRMRSSSASGFCVG